MGLLEFGLVMGMIPLFTPVMKYVVFDSDVMLFFSCCISWVHSTRWVEAWPFYAHSASAGGGGGYRRRRRRQTDSVLIRGRRPGGDRG